MSNCGNSLVVTWSDFKVAKSVESASIRVRNRAVCVRGPAAARSRTFKFGPAQFDSSGHAARRGERGMGTGVVSCTQYSYQYHSSKWATVQALPVDRWWTWAAALVAADLGYYWLHRTCHQVGFLWAGGLCCFLTRCSSWTYRRMIDKTLARGIVQILSPGHRRVGPPRHTIGMSRSYYELRQGLLELRQIGPTRRPLQPVSLRIFLRAVRGMFF